VWYCARELELELGIEVVILALWSVYTALPIMNYQLQILLFDINIGKGEYLGTCYNHLHNFFNFLSSYVDGRADNHDF